MKGRRGGGGGFLPHKKRLITVELYHLLAYQVVLQEGGGEGGGRGGEGRGGGRK